MCRPRHLTMVENYVVHRQKPSCSKQILLAKLYKLSATEESETPSMSRSVMHDDRLIVNKPTLFCTHATELKHTRKHVLLNTIVEPGSRLDLKARGEGCQVIDSQFGLAIHQNDHQARRRFVEWAQNELAVVPDFHKRILFSDKAHFLLNDYVNKQNCRIWSEANPQVYVETPLHPEKLTVWCALWAGGIIGPYFFKNDEGHNVTANGDRLRAIVKKLIFYFTKF
ncbi:hypothetical protein TNCV_2930351 [Trichonephila clavipes]|nr:hypothetical protein TNCV_2930351 [Trichonephila clavipes]